MVLPTAPVPLSVGVVSLVTWPVVRLPTIPPATLSLTVSSTGTVGAVRSTTTLQAFDDRLTLPCGSVALTVKLCGPSTRAVSGVKLHAPVPSAVTMPSCVLPSKIVTTLFASAVPERVGVASLVVLPLTTVVAVLPTSSVTLTISGVVELVSTTMVKPADGALWLPAGSVSRMVRTLLPSASADGVKLQLPVWPTTVVPSRVPLL